MNTRARFGSVTLTGLVVASMVGAGIFTTSGYALADLGTPGRVLWAWLAGGVVALCGAVGYGMLARCVPGSGGEYLYLGRLVHPLAGFIAGWVSMIAGFTGAIAFAATTMEAYLVPGEGPMWLPANTPAIAAVIVAALLHGIRAEAGAIGQNVAVLLKLALLVVGVVGGGAYLALHGGAEPDSSGSLARLSPSAFALAVVWISLSYSGFNAAVYVAGEARDAPRMVPRVLVVGTLVVTVLYLALNIVFLFAPPVEQVAGAADVAAVAARSVGGPELAVAVRGIIALALFTSVLALVMAGPRVYARMADDGVMPRVFAFEGEAPRAAIALQAGLAIGFVCVTELRELLSYLGFTLSLSGAAAVASLFAAHWRRRRAPVASRAYPWVPAVYVLASVGLAAFAARQNPAELVAAAVTLAMGAGIYAAIPWHRRGASEART